MNSLRYFFHVLGNALLSVAGVIGQTVGALFGWRLFRLRRRRTWYAARRRVVLAPRTRRIVRVTLASVVIVASVVWLYVAWRWQVGPPRDRQLDEVLGWGVAEETLRLMTEGGQVVVVAWQPDPLPGAPVGSEIRVQGFLRAIRQRPHVRLRAVERIGAAQFDQQTMQFRNVFPPLVEKYPTADLFVSFVGIPDLDTEPLLQAGRRLPQLLVVTSQTPALRTFFEKKLVTVGIVLRGQAIASSYADLESWPALFEQHFQVITASNVTAVAKLPNAAQP